jgi:ParB family chromosome partitioning protein
MVKRKKKGGLGVGALLSTIDPNIDDDKRKELVSQLSNTIMDIPLGQIEANPENPRVEFDQEALEQLAHSIKTHGLIQPITVRHMGKNQFQLISGERRLRASKIAGLDKVPAYVRLADDNQILELALIENIQRQDLNAIEIATTYDRLLDELELTQETLAKRVGKKRSTVTNYIRLLKLPAHIQNAIQDEELSMGHARTLVNVEDQDLQDVLFQEVTENGASVRKLEKYVKTLNKALPELITAVKTKAISLAHFMIIMELTDIVLQLTVYKKVIQEDLSLEETQLLVNRYQPKEKKEEEKAENNKKEKKLTPAFERLQEGLKSQLSAKVQLKVNDKGKGQIVINFSDTDDLSRILELIDYHAE